MFKRTKQALSLPAEMDVHGIKIRKMPIGAYVDALQKVQELPTDFLAACFPDKTLQEIIDEFSKLDEGGLISLLMTLISTAPRYVVKVIAELCDVDEAVLWNDPEIGIDGLVNIVTAFIEVNKLGESISGVKGSIMKIKTLVK